MLKKDAGLVVGRGGVGLMPSLRPSFRVLHPVWYSEQSVLVTVSPPSLSCWPPVGDWGLNGDVILCVVQRTLT